MMKLVVDFYELGSQAIEKGASVNDLIKMEVRERIGRYKYTLDKEIDKEYENVHTELSAEIANVLGNKEEF